MDTLSRRTFLGATAGVAGMAGLAEARTMAAAGSGEQEEGAKDAKKGLHVGMLTAPFNGETLEKVADFAKSAGIAALEVAAGPGSTMLDPAQFDLAQVDAVKQMLSERGVYISSLAYYTDMTDPAKTNETQTHFKKCIDVAAALGVPTVCGITGWAKDGMSKTQAIKKAVAPAYAPLIAYAKDKGIKIAMENYFETCLQGLDTFECLFETIQDENFGLNYDPSHLYHQQCNYLVPVKMFAKRIFHTHAKDCLVDADMRAKVGVYGKGWWNYVIPGYGNINWAEYIAHLRSIGYAGVMSIEHEDGSLGREEGFIHAARHLNQYC